MKNHTKVSPDPPAPPSPSPQGCSLQDTGVALIQLWDLTRGLAELQELHVGPVPSRPMMSGPCLHNPHPTLASVPVDALCTRSRERNHSENTGKAPWGPTKGPGSSRGSGDGREGTEQPQDTSQTTSRAPALLRLSQPGDIAPSIPMTGSSSTNPPS